MREPGYIAVQSASTATNVRAPHHEVQTGAPDAPPGERSAVQASSQIITIVMTSHISAFQKIETEDL